MSVICSFFLTIFVNFISDRSVILFTFSFPLFSVKLKIFLCFSMNYRSIFVNRVFISTINLLMVFMSFFSIFMCFYTTMFEAKQIFSWLMFTILSSKKWKVCEDSNLLVFSFTISWNCINAQTWYTICIVHAWFYSPLVCIQYF